MTEMKARACPLLQPQIPIHALQQFIQFRHHCRIWHRASLADRRLVLAGVPKEAGDAAWLQQAFRAAGNAEGLKLAERR